MNKYNDHIYKKLVFCSIYALICAGIVHSSYLEEFPERCAEANNKYALPGHILKLGKVEQNIDGWTFSFPDRHERRSLQRIDIADNAGLIGQDPDADYSHALRIETPNNSFVVAQVFVGESNIEPVVTCLSKIIPINNYFPDKYGNEWIWLSRTLFAEKLSWKKFSRWNWRHNKWWQRDLKTIRDRFRNFRDLRDDDNRKYRFRNIRERDNDLNRDRVDNRYNRNKYRDRNNNRRQQKQVSPDDDKPIPKKINDDNDDKDNKPIIDNSVIRRNPQNQRNRSLRERKPAVRKITQMRDRDSNN